jgi:hypothetical protein
VLFDDGSDELITLPVDGAGSPSPAARSRVGELGSIEAGGIAIDASSRTLYVLDRRAGRVAVLPAAVWDDATDAVDRSITWIDLSGVGDGDLRGLAFDASARRFSVVDASAHAVREYDEEGRLVDSLDLADVPLHDPQAVVRAASGDQTDDPSATSLYIADAGAPGQAGSARIVEVAEVAPATTATAAAVPSTLLNTIDTSRWSPPSPDPSGLAYDPATNRLLVSDGEVRAAALPNDGTSTSAA